MQEHFFVLLLGVSSVLSPIAEANLELVEAIDGYEEKAEKNPHNQQQYLPDEPNIQTEASLHGLVYNFSTIKPLITFEDPTEGYYDVDDDVDDNVDDNIDHDIDDDVDGRNNDDVGFSKSLSGVRSTGEVTRLPLNFNDLTPVSTSPLKMENHNELSNKTFLMEVPQDIRNNYSSDVNKFIRNVIKEIKASVTYHKNIKKAGPNDKPTVIEIIIENGRNSNSSKLLSALENYVEQEKKKSEEHSIRKNKELVMESQETISSNDSNTSLFDSADSLRNEVILVSTVETSKGFAEHSSTEDKQYYAVANNELNVTKKVYVSEKSSETQNTHKELTDASQNLVTPVHMFNKLLKPVQMPDNKVIFEDKRMKLENFVNTKYTSAPEVFENTKQINSDEHEDLEQRSQKIFGSDSTYRVFFKSGNSLHDKMLSEDKLGTELRHKPGGLFSIEANTFQDKTISKEYLEGGINKELANKDTGEGSWEIMSPYELLSAKKNEKEPHNNRDQTKNAKKSEYLMNNKYPILYKDANKIQEISFSEAYSGKEFNKKLENQSEKPSDYDIEKMVLPLKLREHEKTSSEEYGELFKSGNMSHEKVPPEDNLGTELRHKLGGLFSIKATSFQETPISEEYLQDGISKELVNKDTGEGSQETMSLHELLSAKKNEKEPHNNRDQTKNAKESEYLMNNKYPILYKEANKIQEISVAEEYSGKEFNKKLENESEKPSDYDIEKMVLPLKLRAHEKTSSEEYGKGSENHLNSYLPVYNMHEMQNEWSPKDVSDEYSDEKELNVRGMEQNKLITSDEIVKPSSMERNLSKHAIMSEHITTRIPYRESNDIQDESNPTRLEKKITQTKLFYKLCDADKLMNDEFQFKDRRSGEVSGETPVIEGFILGFRYKPGKTKENSLNNKLKVFDLSKSISKGINTLNNLHSRLLANQNELKSQTIDSLTSKGLTKSTEVENEEVINSDSSELEPRSYYGYTYQRVDPMYFDYVDATNYYTTY